MKLDVSVNEVILSNVGTTGEFKIRNSAKAFKILSDGLYSNKIRAIIRELSCNALDSHIGANKINIPFEVHLPTILEPWFSVRDFGMGLDAYQVTNIYTTYFESTKTDSNDFIGALGLGSKSPFSYTENFTVTAIKDGIQRIYSAFINDVGVPSIVEMNESLTDECNGVEVKFSVTDRSDYHTFNQEARNVFAWFEHLPVITGIDNFTHLPITYKERNIVPGVHIKEGNYYGREDSIALMGNIPYPLNNIPAIEKNLGNLHHLLQCGLVLEFDIGELDFAASREQLSYIPATIASIKRKLEILNANLSIHLANKANEISSEWERANFLYTEYNNSLYRSSIEKYVKDSGFELFDIDAHGGRKYFDYPIESLDKRNLGIVAFRSQRGSSTRIKESSAYVNTPAGHKYVNSFRIQVDNSVVIILNDLKTGCLSRARYHFASRKDSNVSVYCISHKSVDMSARQIEYDKFISELHNPPVIIKASDLDKQIRARSISTQGIMRIGIKNRCHRGNSLSYTWEPYTEELSDDIIYYYVTLNNHQAFRGDNETPVDIFEIKAMMDNCGIEDINKIQILGIRKNRVKEFKDLDNWVWFEEKLKDETSKISDEDIASLIAKELLDSYYNKVYSDKTVANLVGSDSDYAKYVKKSNSIIRRTGNTTHLATLCGTYGKIVKVKEVREEIEDMKKSVLKKYPLLKLCREGSDDVTKKQIANYIMMVDKQ